MPDLLHATEAAAGREVILVTDNGDDRTLTLTLDDGTTVRCLPDPEPPCAVHSDPEAGLRY